MERQIGPTVDIYDVLRKSMSVDIDSMMDTGLGCWSMKYNHPHFRTVPVFRTVMMVFVYEDSHACKSSRLVSLRALKANVDHQC